MKILSLTLVALAAVASAPAQAGASLLEYQFNEARGSTVANVSTSPAFPSFGTLQTATWRRDPGRPVFSGNDAGTGCLAQTPAPSNHYVDTGAPVNHVGSLTVMFWARRDPSSTSSSPFGYFFGDGRFRCFMGSAGVLLGSHGPIASTLTARVSGHLVQGVWNHYAIVIDDALGQARIHENGIADPATVTFPAGTYAYTGAANLAIAVNGIGNSSAATVHYDMDDFRMYAAALTQAQIMGLMIGESPSATVSGAGCAGPGGVPTIGVMGGAPQIGNTGFAIVAGNLETGRPQALNLGLFPGAALLPFDLAGLLGAGFTGCSLEILADVGALVLPGAPSALLPLPIPNAPGIAGAHLHAQAIVLGASQGAVSPLLDVNIQN